MKVGDLIKVKHKHSNLGLIGIITGTKPRPGDDPNAIFCFVHFPDTGWSQWFHPTRLVVISEA